ncbi:universal stress protein [Halobacteria archaeon AArc-dxtr1]|nr:universal stress protein [Halobacteria archaeon AArc-dxtr1]
MTDHIVVPMDGSPLSKRALDVALSEHPDATVDVLHVVDPTEPGYSYQPFDSTAKFDREPLHGSEEWYERAEELSETLFEDVREQASEHDAEIETELVVGLPAREIVDYVEDHDVDHVVIGSHGRTEDARILLGSVSEAVAFQSPVRVTLVR